MAGYPTYSTYCKCQPESIIESGCDCVNAECAPGYSPECQTFETEGLVNNFEAGYYTGSIVSNGAAFRNLNSDKINNQEDITPYEDYNFIKGFDQLVCKRGPGKYRLKLTNLVVNHEYDGIANKIAAEEQIIIRVKTFSTPAVTLWDSGLISSNIVQDVDPGECGPAAPSAIVTFPVIQGFDEVFDIPVDPNRAYPVIKIELEVLTPAYQLLPFCGWASETVNYQSGTLDASFLTQTFEYVCVNDSDSSVTQEPVITECVDDQCSNLGNCGESLVTCPVGYEPTCVADAACDYFFSAEPISDTQLSEGPNGSTIIASNLNSANCASGLEGIEPTGLNNAFRKIRATEDGTYNVSALTEVSGQMSIMYFCAKERLVSTMSVTIALRKEGSNIPLFEKVFDLQLPQSPHSSCSGAITVLIPEWEIPNSLPITATLLEGDVIFWDVNYNKNAYAFNFMPSCSGCGNFNTAEYRSYVKNGSVVGFSTAFERGTYEYKCVNSLGELITPTSVEECINPVILQGYTIFECGNPNNKYNITITDQDLLYLNKIYTLDGDARFNNVDNSKKCFSVSYVGDLDEAIIDIQDASVDFEYEASECGACISDNEIPTVYTIIECDSNTLVTISLLAGESISLNHFYYFDFNPGVGYQVLYTSPELAADNVDVVPTKNASPEEGCEGLLDCYSFRDCKNNSLINIEFQNLEYVFEPGVVYRFKNSDFLQNDSWTYVGKVDCSVEPKQVITDAVVEELTCNNCSTGLNYYQLTNCKTQDFRLVFTEKNFKLIEGQAYIFKDDINNAYTATLLDRICDEEEIVTTYLGEDLYNTLPSCEDYLRKCYKLTDCETGAETVTSDPTMASYLGKTIQWWSTWEDEKIIRCAVVTEFNCFDEDYVQVEDGKFSPLNDNVSDILYIDSVNLIQDQIAAGGISNSGAQWEFEELDEFKMIFSRPFLEYFFGSWFEGTEYMRVSLTYGKALRQEILIIEDCFKDCDKCLYLEIDDCVTEEDLVDTRPSCFNINNLCNEEYGSMLSVLTNGLSDDSDLQNLLSQARSKPEHVYSNVTYLISAYVGNKCSDITTDRNSITQAFNDIMGTEYEDYYNDIYNAAIAVLNIVEPLILDYVTQYNAWTNSNYEDSLLPSLYKDARLYYTDKSGNKVSQKVGHNVSILRKKLNPIYVLNPTYEGFLNYNVWFESKSGYSNSNCV